MAIDFSGMLLISTGRCENEELTRKATDDLRELMTQMRGPLPWEPTVLQDLVEDKLEADFRPDDRALTCGLHATLAGYRVHGAHWSPERAQALYEICSRRWPVDAFVHAMSKRWPSLTFVLADTNDCSWPRGLLKVKAGEILDDRYEENALSKEIWRLYKELEAVPAAELAVPSGDAASDPWTMQLEWAHGYHDALRLAFEQGRDDVLDSDLRSDWLERRRQAVIENLGKRSRDAA